MVYAPGTLETDPKKQNMALQQQASSIKTNTADIATNTANIATNTANIATNTANIATNTANIATNTSDISALKTPGYGLTYSGGLIVGLSKITASLGADVTLNNTANYFDGPSCAQGTTGTWLAIGQVVCVDTSSAASFNAKLWDGTTIIASGSTTTGGANFRGQIFLSGFITSPAANIKISVSDIQTTNGLIKANTTGLSKDSQLTVVRIA